MKIDKKTLFFRPRSSGIGSALRSNTFKNMVVGAAAGYLTYKAGKAIIRNIGLLQFYTSF